LILEPTPYTLHPTPYTLHPTPEALEARGLVPGIEVRSRRYSTVQLAAAEFAAAVSAGGDHVHRCT